MSKKEFLNDRLNKKLSEREAQNLFRVRKAIHARSNSEVSVEKQKLINFSSNDYLGLSTHPSVISSFKQAADKYGVGSSASAMVTGRYDVHQELEEKIAEKTGREAALVFSSGYLANLALTASILNKDDIVILDKLSHASLIDAAKISDAKMFRYHHVDPESLRQRLEKQTTTGKKLVVTDGVFSMDGDKAPLKELIVQCDQYNAILAVDDAHGFGVLGQTGGGLLEETGFTKDVDALIATFGKALGTAGAFIAGDRALIETLVQLGRTYIYTTALAPALAQATLKAFDVLQEEVWRRQQLNDLIDQFKTGAKELGINLLSSDTAIQPVIIGDAKKAISVSQQLEDQGFLVTAIRPPTVPEGSSRLRITLTANHTTDQVEQLLTSLDKCLVS